MLCCQDWFFFPGKGKLIAKRDENLFSYWLGGAECQDGGGQLWGKAGRPAAFCLSHALLHRVCDKTSLQEYWANTESLSLGAALFPGSGAAKKLHTSITVFTSSFSKLNCCRRYQRCGISMIRKSLFGRQTNKRLPFSTLWQLATRNKVKHVVSDSTSSQSACALTVRGCRGSASRDEGDNGGWGRNHFHTATITGTVITLLTLTQIQIEAPKNYAQARRRKWLTSVC